MGLLTRRRRYFVQRKFQGRFIATFGALALVAAAAAAAATSIAVDGALSDAMFRAHISQRSTGQIVLPVLLKVNGLVAAVASIGSIVAAVLVFRSAAAGLDDLCFRLAQWEWQLTEGASNGQASPFPDGPHHWTADFEQAMCTADESLRARYRPLAERAGRVAGAARVVEAALADPDPSDRIRSEIERIGRDIAALDEELSRFQG